MPVVDVKMRIVAPPAAVWKLVCAIDDYPGYMTDVRSVVVTGDPTETVRGSSWSVSLRGSILEWTELDRFDEPNGRIDFHQTDGDLERFSGHWSIDPVAGQPDSADVSFYVDFEIGIPLLADMLNPIAQRSLRDNAIRMLEAFERQIRRAA